MKNYLTEWKKYLLKEGSQQTKEAITALEAQLNAAKNENQKEKDKIIMENDEDFKKTEEMINIILKGE
jgi:hypothetical protein